MDPEGGAVRRAVRGKSEELLRHLFNNEAALFSNVGRPTAMSVRYAPIVVILRVPDCARNRTFSMVRDSRIMHRFVEPGFATA
jgi:hypothetical protein